MRIMLVLVLLCGCNYYDSAYNDILSGLEGLFYDKDEGQRQLVEMREDIATAEEMISWYADVGFEYDKDPLDGLIDFMSEPWVTVQKKAGDCDDIAVLTECILRGKYEESGILIIERGSSGHAAFVYFQSQASITDTKWYMEEGWYISGMTWVRGPYDTLEDVADSVYVGYDHMAIINYYSW